MNRRKIFTTAAVLATIPLVVWGSLILSWEYKETEQARYTYTGTVTAIVHGDQIDKVWLNSFPEVIKIQGTVELVIGERYEITINGFSRLINAKILESRR